ncbi:hypothetical protein ISS30_04005 [bacterium]|nr:hypothetical protein [bacterium]
MLLWLLIFSIAMAYLESAVVVYLRMLYYPDGFTFPIVLIETRTALIELGREAATIVMLYGVARLTYKKALHRFCAFMFCFGVWDICYYFWLYVFLKWPPGLLTWDILFLIPVPWLGPVIAPVIVSISMIVSAVIIIKIEERGKVFHNNWRHWVAAVIGGVVIILSFTIDFHIVPDGLIPDKFAWGLFLLGEALGISALAAALYRTFKEKHLR